MPNINETVEVARKVLPVIYVLDTSGSMMGERITAVNEAMRETMEVVVVLPCVPATAIGSS